MANGRYPDRAWFWAVVFTIIPEWAQQYYDQVLKNREEQRRKDFGTKKIIKISDKWKKKLCEHSFVSRSKYALILF